MDLQNLIDFLPILVYNRLCKRQDRVRARHAPHGGVSRLVRADALLVSTKTPETEAGIEADILTLSLSISLTTLLRYGRPLNSSIEGESCGNARSSSLSLDCTSGACASAHRPHVNAVAVEVWPATRRVEISVARCKSGTGVLWT